MENVKVTLPDGTQKEFPKGTTAREVAQSIGTGLAKAALAAKVDDHLVDLNAPLEADSEFHIITPSFCYLQTVVDIVLGLDTGQIPLLDLNSLLSTY